MNSFFLTIRFCLISKAIYIKMKAINLKVLYSFCIITFFTSRRITVTSKIWMRGSMKLIRECVFLPDNRMNLVFFRYQLQALGFYPIVNYSQRSVCSLYKFGFHSCSQLMSIPRYSWRTSSYRLLRNVPVFCPLKVAWCRILCILLDSFDKILTKPISFFIIFVKLFKNHFNRRGKLMKIVHNYFHYFTIVSVIYHKTTKLSRNPHLTRNTHTNTQKLGQPAYVRLVCGIRYLVNQE